MSPPLVSVIVPACNAEPYLREAVQSVLRQTHERLELVLVDDGSTDGTPALADALAASDPRVRVLHQRNGGLSAARNAGLAAAKGDLVCFLDADDALLPDKLERQLRFLELFPGCDLVFSDFYVGDEQLTPTFLVCTRPPPIPMRELLAYGNWFGPMSPLLRARLVARVGPFDEQLRAAEDWDYWVRASRCGTFSYLPGPVAVYRTHPGQMHRDGAHMLRNQREALAKNFARGGPEWRASRSARAWKDAKLRWGDGKYLRVAGNLWLWAWYARSHRIMLNVIRFTSRYP